MTRLCWVELLNSAGEPVLVLGDARDWATLTAELVHHLGCDGLDPLCAVLVRPGLATANPVARIPDSRHWTTVACDLRHLIRGDR